MPQEIDAKVLYWLLATARKLEKIASSLCNDGAAQRRAICLDSLVPQPCLRAEAPAFVPKHVLEKPEIPAAIVTKPETFHHSGRWELLPSVGTWVLPKPAHVPSAAGQSEATQISHTAKTIEYTLDDLIVAAQAQDFAEITKIYIANPPLGDHYVKPVFKHVLIDSQNKISDAEREALEVREQIDQAALRLEELRLRASKLAANRRTRAAGAEVLRDAENNAVALRSAKVEELRQADLRVIKLRVRLKLLQEIEPMIYSGDTVGVGRLQTRLPDLSEAQSSDAQSSQEG